MSSHIYPGRVTSSKMNATFVAFRYKSRAGLIFRRINLCPPSFSRFLLLDRVIHSSWPLTQWWLIYSPNWNWPHTSTWSTLDVFFVRFCHFVRLLACNLYQWSFSIYCHSNCESEWIEMKIKVEKEGWMWWSPPQAGVRGVLTDLFLGQISGVWKMSHSGHLLNSLDGQAG